MPREQVHAPLSADDAAQAVVPTTKIDWRDREIDPNARWQSEQRLPQPANHRSHVRGIAAFFETKPKTGTELELDLFRSGARQPHWQERQSFALHRCRPGGLVQVVLQRGVGDSMFGRHGDARNRALFRFSYDSRPKFCSVPE